jgi:hypothetical protein
MDGRSVRIGCFSLIAIVVWTLIGIVGFGVIVNVLGSIVSLIDPQVDYDDNPLAFLVLLAFPIALIVPFVGSVLTILWLRRRFDSSD